MSCGSAASHRGHVCGALCLVATGWPPQDALSVSDSLDMLLMVHEKTNALATALIDHCVEAEQRFMEDLKAPLEEDYLEDEGEEVVGVVKKANGGGGSQHQAGSRSQEALSHYVKIQVIHRPRAGGAHWECGAWPYCWCLDGAVRGAVHRPAGLVPGEGGLPPPHPPPLWGRGRRRGSRPHQHGQEAQASLRQDRERKGRRQALGPARHPHRQGGQTDVLGGQGAGRWQVSTDDVVGRVRTYRLTPTTSCSRTGFGKR